MVIARGAIRACRWHLGLGFMRPRWQDQAVLAHALMAAFANRRVPLQRSARGRATAAAGLAAFFAASAGYAVAVVGLRGVNLAIMALLMGGIIVSLVELAIVSWYAPEVEWDGTRIRGRGRVDGVFDVPLVAGSRFAAAHTGGATYLWVELPRDHSYVGRVLLLGATGMNGAALWEALGHPRPTDALW